MQFRFKILTLLCLLHPAVLLAEGVQSLTDIQEAVKMYLLENFDSAAEGELNVEVGRLDSRLRLSYCSDNLHVSVPYGTQDTVRTVKVQCFSPKAWTVYLPVKMSRYLPVVVAKTGLNRDQPLRSEDLVIEMRNVSVGSSGYFTEVASVLGMVGKYTITPGNVITPKMLKQAILVKRNDPVIIRAQSGGLRVQMNGKAMGQGAKGEVISVKNTQSNRLIEARVEAAGIVSVTI